MWHVPTLTTRYGWKCGCSWSGRINTPRSSWAHRPPTIDAWRTQKTLLLTSASRGIGHATVKHFHAAEWRVITVPPAVRQDLPWPQGVRRTISRRISTTPSITMPPLPASAPSSRNRKLAVALRRWSTMRAFRRSSPVANEWACLIPTSRPGRTCSTSTCFRPHCWARLVRRIEGGAGQRGQCHLGLPGQRCIQFAGVLRDVEGRPGCADARWRTTLVPWGTLQCHRTGEIDTSILSPGTADIVEREIPMKRLGKPSEVAQLIYFLCTSQSSYVNGAEIHVNGGEHV